MISTVIINPQRHYREKISSLLSAQGGFRVLAQGKDGYDALRLISNFKPDIAILDTHLEFIEGEEIPPLLRCRSPATAVVILIARISDYQLIRAVSNDISGFISRDTDMDTLPLILKTIVSGGCFISSAFTARVLQLFAQGYSRKNAKALQKGGRTGKISPAEDPSGYLSKKELKILSCIGQGYSCSQIAGELNFVPGTVRNYASKIMRKIGLESRAQMVRYAVDYGLVPHN